MMLLMDTICSRGLNLKSDFLSVSSCFSFVSTLRVVATEECKLEGTRQHLCNTNCSLLAFITTWCHYLIFMLINPMSLYSLLALQEKSSVNAPLCLWYSFYISCQTRTGSVFKTFSLAFCQWRLLKWSKPCFHTRGCFTVVTLHLPTLKGVIT